jgi:nifR3 family TIM-barrel protein
MRPLPEAILPNQPLTALAPMQDVTDLAFMKVIAHYGPPDFFFTEFFRVHAQSKPEKHILRSIDENKTTRPVFAQLIGEETDNMVRSALDILKHPAAGIDLNLGCPAPKVYKKNVGGGLLRDPERIATIISCLREAIPGLFTVKMRLGFNDESPMQRVVEIVNQNHVNLLTVHGRTVKGGYRSEVNYDSIATLVRQANCPVLANGDITSAYKAAAVLTHTKAAGVMIGRHAIRNPWIFKQCRDFFAGRKLQPITLADVDGYIKRLFEATRNYDFPELAHVNKMKKYLNFIGQSVDATGAFLYDMRRVTSEKELSLVCKKHLLDKGNDLFSVEPYPGIIARPNCETPDADGCSLDSITA